MSETFLGEIRPFAGTFAIQGWAFCDGSLLSIAQNSALFSLIGTTYGGDGQTTFALPDLRGRALVHQGTGPGLSPSVPGEMAGQETVTVTPGQMAGHTHTVGATTAAASTPTPGPSVVLAATPSGSPIYDGTAAAIALAPNAVSASGGTQPHENRQPYLALSYIIALDGIYPTQN